MEWVWNNLPKIGGFTLDHIGLTVIPIVVGFVVAVPLGYWASKSKPARSVLLTVFSILYTLPSLVLFVAVPLALGLPILDSRNVVIALTIYAIAIMLRTATDGFSSVSDEVRESARAIGFSSVQRFFRVELPLAGPVLLSGLRIVSVSTVSLATVGSFIGIDSLGNLFIEGQQNYNPAESLAGIVTVLLLALVYDVILTIIGRILLPWNRRGRTRRASRRVRTAEAA